MDDGATDARPAPDDPPAFDHYARLVRRLLGVPIATVTEVEVDRQVYLGASGLPDDLDAARQTPLSHSLCRLVVEDQEPVVIDDLRGESRTSTHPAVLELGATAYAGWPLVDYHDQVVGTVCAIDTEPRHWSEDDIVVLRDLAAACSAEFSERQRRLDTAAALATARDLGDRSRVLLALSVGLGRTSTLAEVASALVTVTAEQLGSVRAGLWLREPSLLAAGADRPAAGEALTFCEDADSTWQSASTFSTLAVDHTNPLGEAVLDGARFYRSRAEQHARFPHLANPHQLGEARAFLPLRVGSRSFGALAAMWPDERDFSDADRLTLETLASYAAQAVDRAVLLEDRIRATVTLQEALLSVPPLLPGLTLAARYRPAAEREQVGGDWYDAFVAPDGDLRVVIGDVAGHDVRAAASMGQLRSMLRMTVWRSAGSPAQDLQELDGAMEALGVDALASAVLARVGPVRADGTRTLTWSNAGHPPPLLVDPSGGARLLLDVDVDVGVDVEVDGQAQGPLLGVDPGPARRDGVLQVPAGSTLLLYTDGLVERRRRPLDDGIDRLRAAVSALGPVDPDVMVDGVLAHLTADLPAEHRRITDDTALLAVRLDD